MHPFRRVTYETQRALDNVSFSVDPGEFFGIVGPNGSGKSTLLKILAGIYRADSGSVRVDGLLSPFIELGVGFNLELNARDNVRDQRNSARTLASRAGRALRRDHRASPSSNASSTRSSRTTRRVCRCDLPTRSRSRSTSTSCCSTRSSPLATPAFQEKCFATFERFREEKKTIVLVTHDLYTIGAFADRALLLRSGVVEAIGKPDDVIARYQSPPGSATPVPLTELPAPTHAP